ncbi:MAG: aromatic ring-hydroxylating dioxygenase subunit alpha [Hellea sp.]|nr:aromatic ring-hydroxylating dioxygenase subunit alpha [Hellea sp.]
MSDFVMDIWYFAGISKDVKPGEMHRIEIAGEPINLGRSKSGEVFAMRDICPHWSAPLSKGRIVDGTVECPYHGWRFGTSDGTCKAIPALCSEDKTDTQKIRVRTYPIREVGALIWVFLSKDKKGEDPKVDPPSIPFAKNKPIIDDIFMLDCPMDQAVIGLMDPAHGPFVHQNKWWRTQGSMHDKAKKFEPRPLGFAMAAHSPSSNSFAYKLLGGKPTTEITFYLPGARTEEIKVGKRTILSLTIVSPVDDERTTIRQLFFTDMLKFKMILPLARSGARKFLRQDRDIMALQKMGLKYNPKQMYVGDADAQARWYFVIKKEWAKSRAEGREFVNPVKPQTLRYRS